MILSNQELWPSPQIEKQTPSLNLRARGNKPLACPHSEECHFAFLQDLFQSNDIS